MAAKSGEILGLTEIIARSQTAVPNQFHPVIVAVEDAKTASNIDAARAAVGQALRVIVLRAGGVATLDSAIISELRALSQVSAESIADLVRSVAGSIDLDDLVARTDEGSTSPIQARFSDKRLRRPFVRYLTWLRTLALASQRESSRKPVNFDTYVYVPWPDMAGQSTRTITSGFAGWPPADLLQWMVFDAPKAFQRYEVLLPRRYWRHSQDVIAHETSYLVDLAEHLSRHEETEALSYALYGATLYFGKDPGGDAINFIPDPHDRRVLPWCRRLVNRAWQIHVARIALHNPRNHIAETLKVVMARPSVDVSAGLTLCGDFAKRGGDWETFDWDISRWLLAAVSNAMKYVMPFGAPISLEIAEERIRSINVSVFRAGNQVTFAVTNLLSGGRASDNFGTRQVLELLAHSTAGYRAHRFGIVGDSQAEWEASVEIADCI